MNADETPSQPDAKELPWLAFLYVSEELSPDEVADFEDRLLIDQTAREAVADAMKMADGLWMASALDSLSVKPSAFKAPSAEGTGTFGMGRGISRLALWIGGTVVAASLAFCVGWWLAPQRVSPDSPSFLANQTSPQADSETPASLRMEIEGAEQLLGIWTNSQALLAELDSRLLRDDRSEISEDSHFREPQEPEEDAFAWMLAALSVDSPEVSPIHPDAMENQIQ